MRRKKIKKLHAFYIQKCMRNNLHNVLILLSACFNFHAVHYSFAYAFVSKFSLKFLSKVLCII